MFSSSENGLEWLNTVDFTSSFRSCASWYIWLTLLVMHVLLCTPNDASRATASILSGSSPSLLQRFQNVDDCHRGDYGHIYSDREGDQFMSQGLSVCRPLRWVFGRRQEEQTMDNVFLPGILPCSEEEMPACPSILCFSTIYYWVLHNPEDYGTTLRLSPSIYFPLIF